MMHSSNPRTSIRARTLDALDAFLEDFNQPGDAPPDEQTEHLLHGMTLIGDAVRAGASVPEPARAWFKGAPQENRLAAFVMMTEELRSVTIPVQRAEPELDDDELEQLAAVLDARDRSESLQALAVWSELRLDDDHLEESRRLLDGLCRRIDEQLAGSGWTGLDALDLLGARGCLCSGAEAYLFGPEADDVSLSEEGANEIRQTAGGWVDPPAEVVDWFFEPSTQPGSLPDRLVRERAAQSDDFACLIEDVYGSLALEDVPISPAAKQFIAELNREPEAIAAQTEGDPAPADADFIVLSDIIPEQELVRDASPVGYVNVHRLSSGAARVVVVVTDSAPPSAVLVNDSQAAPLGTGRWYKTVPARKGSIVVRVSWPRGDAAIRMELRPE